MEGNAMLNFSDITNFETLQLLASDLSRRLENANNTIEAQKKIAKNSIAVAQDCRQHLMETSNNLRFELSKCDYQNRQKLKVDETHIYEVGKKQKHSLEEQIRMARIDYDMTAAKPLLKKIDQYTKKVNELEMKQESQKRFLTHLVELEKMTEELSNAAQLGDLLNCRKLMRRGVSLNDIDSAGFLPVHYACAAGHDHIVRFLCEYGQDPSSYLTGHSAVEIAARNGHMKVIEVLISFGASIEDMGSRGCPPLLSAVEKGYLSCVDSLLTLGANIHAVDKNEDSVLHLAFVDGEGDLEGMVRLLLSYGANPSLKNMKCLTPLDLAISTKNNEVIKLLCS